MSESPEVSVLVHELGGMLSSVQGFAHIAEANPDHPDRERFIKLAASEARRAAQTVKDLHLVRSLDRGAISQSPQPVPLSALMNDVDGAVEVRVDPAKLSGPLSRALEKAVEPPRVDGSTISFPIGPADELARKVEALDAPYPDMVVLSIVRRLLRHWGGDVTLAADGGWTVVTLAFPGA